MRRTLRQWLNLLSVAITENRTSCQLSSIDVYLAYGPGVWGVQDREATSEEGRLSVS